MPDRVPLKQIPGPLLVAHRGDSRAAPENTWPAFESAIQLGVDLIELDYRHAADGVPVVFHDKTLDRATNALALSGGRDLPFDSKTSAELLRLDAGAWFDPKFAGTRLSTLEDVLTRAVGQVCVMIERKAGDADTLIKLLRKLDCVDRVIVQAFEWSFIEDCHALEPNLMLGALGSDDCRAEQVEAAASIGAQVVGWKQEKLSPEAIRIIHDQGLAAWAWTVDDPQRARFLLDAGLDAVISNVPRQMKPLIERWGQITSTFPRSSRATQ